MPPLPPPPPPLDDLPPPPPRPPSSAVTIDSVFKACANTPGNAANALPLVVFYSGRVKPDKSAGRLLMLRFRPFLPTVTLCEDVKLHIHSKPYQGSSGINLRGESDPEGEVGSGVGQMSHGTTVPNDSPYIAFFRELKSEAVRYVSLALKLAIDRRKFTGTVGPKWNPNAPEAEQLAFLWSNVSLWGDFDTDEILLSGAAEAVMKQSGVSADSLRAVKASVSFGATSAASKKKRRGRKSEAVTV